MSIFKSVDEHLRREQSLFRSLDYGPIRGRCHDGGVTVETATGLTVELSANTVLDRNLDRELLAAGIEVATDGDPVARLRQTEHRLGRGRRVLHLLGMEDGRFPPGAYFRLRGVSALSLETADTRLIRYRPGLRWLTVAPQANEELVAIFAAVHIGLTRPLEQAVVWKR